MPHRPPREWFHRCTADVAVTGTAIDPAAVCGATWAAKGPRERRATVRLEEGMATKRKKKKKHGGRKKLYGAAAKAHAKRVRARHHHHAKKPAKRKRAKKAKKRSHRHSEMHDWLNKKFGKR